MSEQQPPAPGGGPGGGRRRSRRGGRRPPGGGQGANQAAAAPRAEGAAPSGPGPGAPGTSSNRTRRRGRGGSGNRGPASGRGPGPSRQPPGGGRPAPAPAREAELNDQDALVRLQAAGFVLEEVHELEAFIYFPNEANARRALPLLEQAGYLTYPEPTGDGRWVVEAVIRAAPVPEYVATMRSQLRGLVGPLGGLYDGWWATPIDEEAEAEEARLAGFAPPPMAPGPAHDLAAGVPDRDRADGQTTPPADGTRSEPPADRGSPGSPAPPEG